MNKKIQSYILVLFCLIFSSCMVHVIEDLNIIKNDKDLLLKGKYKFIELRESLITMDIPEEKIVTFNEIQKGLTILLNSLLIRATQIDSTKDSMYNDWKRDLNNFTNELDNFENLLNRNP